MVDEDLARLLTRLHVSGALDNTVLILMGDHGNRFDAIRKTVIGRVEERMPFFSVTLPKKLHYLKTNLDANSNVLTSWHDVYEMLMDLAMDNLKPVSKRASLQIIFYYYLIVFLRIVKIHIIINFCYKKLSRTMHKTIHLRMRITILSMYIK